MSSPKLVGIFVLWQPTGQPAKWYLRFKKQKHVWCLYNIHKFEIFQEVLVPFFLWFLLFLYLREHFFLPSVSVQCCCVSISGASGGMLTSKQNLFSLNVLIMNIWGHKILFAQSLFSLICCILCRVKNSAFTARVFFSSESCNTTTGSAPTSVDVRNVTVRSQEWLFKNWNMVCNTLLTWLHTKLQCIYCVTFSSKADRCRQMKGW